MSRIKVKIPYKYLYAILIIFIYAVIYIIAKQFYTNIFVSKLKYFIFVLITNLIILISTIIFYYRFKRKNDFLTILQISSKMINVCLIVFLFIIYAVTFYLTNFKVYIKVLLNLQSMTVFLTIFLVPITEELYFRGLIFSLLDNKLNKYLIVCISAVLFALIHFHTTFITIGVMFVIGVCAGLLVVFTKSIHSAIYFHITWNCVSYIVNSRASYSINVLTTLSILTIFLYTGLAVIINKMAVKNAELQ